MVYSYAPARSAEHAAALLKGYTGVLQTDGYAAYRSLADGVWRFIEAPSVQSHVRVLPRSIGALGTREGAVALCVIVLGGRGDSEGLRSGRALAVVGSFH